MCQCIHNRFHRATVTESATNSAYILWDILSILYWIYGMRYDINMHNDGSWIDYHLCPWFRTMGRNIMAKCDWLAVAQDNEIQCNNFMYVDAGEYMLLTLEVAQDFTKPRRSFWMTSFSKNSYAIGRNIMAKCDWMPVMQDNDIQCNTFMYVDVYE